MSNVLKLVFLVLHCTLYGKAADKCMLYEKPGPLNCLNGAEVTEKLTNSDSCWVVEFYSNWCGHCQNFAPTWKRIAYDVEGWKPFLQLGVVNCAENENSDVCRRYKIMAYPTIKFFSPHLDDPISNGGQDFRGSRSPEAIKKQFVDLLFKQSFKLPPVQDLRLRDFLELKKTTLSMVILFEAENGDNARMLGNESYEMQCEFTSHATGCAYSHSPFWISTPTTLQRSYIGWGVLSLDLATVSHDNQISIYSVSSSEQLLANHLSVSTFPSLVLINTKDTHVYNKETMQSDELRRGFLEAIQQWLRKTSNDDKTITKLVTSSSPSNLQKSRGVIVNKPVQLNKKNKADVITLKPHLSDLQSAIGYTLRQEVSLHSIVSGGAFNALFQFCQLLEQVFEVLDRPTGKVLSSINFQLRSRKQAGFMLSRDWLKLLDVKLDPSMAVLPTKPHWVSCAGSEPKYRGYPCGLWMLLHTVTIHCFPLVQYSDQNVIRPQYRAWSIDSFGALKIVRDYVVNFFTCEHCREHFSQMSMNLEASVTDDVSAILWLWSAHNSVNKRLANDITADPTHPKVQFPDHQLCQTCFITSSNNTLKWNRTAVIIYLFDFYGMGIININDAKSRTNIQGQLLSIRSSPDNRGHRSPASSPPFSLTDISLCFLLYILMAIMLLTFFIHLYYKRRRRKLAKFIV